MEVANLMAEFKNVYHCHSQGKHNLEAQIPYLSRLGDIYLERGKVDPEKNWTSILKAHSLFHSCAGRSPTEETAAEFHNKALSAHNTYNQACQIAEVSKEAYERLKSKHKTILKCIRAKCIDATKPFDGLIESYQTQPGELDSKTNHQIEGEFCSRMKSLSKQCTEDMIALTEVMVSDSVNLMRTSPPCGFAVVAIGSMARQEMTPYSDLEFFFLIENKSSSVEQYFERLAMEIYFLIGTLGETNLKCMNIAELKDWFEDEGMNGFRIDGLQSNAGNIPTGNGCTDPKNKYICTVNELVARYHHIRQNPHVHLVDDEEVGPTGDDSDILTYLCTVYTHENGEELFSRLREAQHQYFPYDQSRIEASWKMMFEDIVKYGEDALEICCLQYGNLSVKSQLYRLPSLLIMDLKLLFNLKSSSQWETLLQLHSEAIISQTLSLSLSTLLAVILHIRLKAYLQHDKQNDKITITTMYHTDAAWAQSSQTKGPCIIQKNLFFIYSISLQPIKEYLPDITSLGREIKQNRNIAGLMFSRAIRDYDTFIQYSDEIGIQGLLEITDSWRYIFLLACLYNRKKRYTDSIRLLRETFMKSKSASGEIQHYSLMVELYQALRNHDDDDMSDEIKMIATYLQEYNVCNLLPLDANGPLIRCLYRLKVSGFALLVDVKVLNAHLTNNPDGNELYLLGLLRVLEDDYPNALAYIRQSIDAVGRNSENAPQLAVNERLQDYLGAMAFCEESMGNYQNCEKIHKQILVLDLRENASKNTLYRAGLYLSLGRCIVLTKQRLGFAEKALRCGLRILKQLKVHESHRYISCTYVYLSRIHFLTGDPFTGGLYFKEANMYGDGWLHHRHSYYKTNCTTCY